MVQRLVQELRQVVADGPVGHPEVVRIESLVRASLPRLKACKLCSLPLKPGRYLCYKDPDFGFVIMALVWGPGLSTPIHDHGCWGVEAVLKSALRVTNYTEDEREPRPLDTLLAAEGAIMHNLPPARDVHKVEYAGTGQGELALSLHIYGREMTGNRSFVPGEGFKPCRLDSCKLDIADLEEGGGSAAQRRVGTARGL
jgi:predicted metal-dependent enzyme (double-stranded beta helix superfamily)